MTRSGTNKLSGALYEFVRNTRLDSNSYQQAPGASQGAARTQSVRRRPRRPIRRDRAFFFVNYDGMRRTQETSQTVTVPTASLRSGVFRFVTQACAGETAARNRPTCVDANGARWCRSRRTASWPTIRGSSGWTR